MADTSLSRAYALVEPAAFPQCQALTKESVSAKTFMQIGWVEKGWVRCTAPPTILVVEIVPDEVEGYMTVCTSCLEVLRKDAKKYTKLELRFLPITQLLLRQHLLVLLRHKQIKKTERRMLFWLASGLPSDILRGG